MKKSFIVLSLSAALTLAACSSESTNLTPADQPQSSEAAAPRLIGSWEGKAEGKDEVAYTAGIYKDKIVVEWNLDEHGSPVYWVGTFDPTVEDGVVTSQIDHAATETALMASSDETKDFTVDGDEITFPVSVQDFQTTITLTKTNDTPPSLNPTAPSDATTSFFDGTLETSALKIAITDHRIIQPGEEGNSYGDKPIIAFFYDITNKTEKNVTVDDFGFYFDAVQDNDPNVVNELEFATYDVDGQFEKQMQKIKKDGTASGSRAFALDDETTPVDLIAHGFGSETEIGRVTYPLD
ncbi:DUF5067 domain-containing protein [Corynebacterium phoceense]|uniref:DUF5067 domain-containing protein n=1 Tax=Corynebacterium phoceense TaxID=1686286 RepID=UPI00211BF8EE|nr:DUF5067 domain-containing protein [Corynebacterium phoceense]MCQ9335010.1 DUF5067 domain-containing protein [Corynebacterium phoceense]